MTLLMQVNEASQEMLEGISGIGPSTSQNIVDRRPFKSLDELMDVPGIGKKRMAIIEAYFGSIRGSSGMKHRENKVDEPSSKYRPNCPHHYGSKPPQRFKTEMKVLDSTHDDPTQETRMQHKTEKTMDNAMARNKEKNEQAIAHVKIDINLATALSLQTIRGIGPKLSQRIVERRPFACVEELTSVRGMGPAILASIQNCVAVVRNPIKSSKKVTVLAAQNCIPRSPKVSSNRVLGTWNVHHLSKTRPLASLELMIRVLKPFDIIALQEVHDVIVVKRLANLLRTFDYVVSDPVGRPGHWERYCYLYRKTLGLSAKRVHLPRESMTAVAMLTRPPFIVSFEGSRRSLVLVNVHVVFGQRQHRVDEISVLKDLLRRLRDGAPSEIERLVILLGDFNLPPYDIGHIRGWDPILRPPHSTTIFNNLYDNIWLQPEATVVDSGVVRIDHIYFPATASRPYKSKEAAFARHECSHKLSDHCPVFVALQ
ncbi:hypothetical protein LEN26_010807 [Aphanomyces euteiches]|nr:hypothetical protein AeMF1_018982 [Aphanomyces euteiches]KAH9121121.1 hypothetical protein LEN26_010807 [Aphanomyces euteiches]KAH9193276.1 hypothetical protein AeNC1_004757 [Aphanomyces euteiches]